MSGSDVIGIKPLSADQVYAYERDGLLVLRPDELPAGYLRQCGAQVPAILSTDGPQRVLERDGRTVRSVYGVHQSSAAVRAVAMLPALLGAAAQLLDSEVYIHQSKLNVKAAFAGDRWEWHQDYVNWLDRDGIKAPCLINLALFLDEVTEFNGPLTFIPGSHRAGLLAGTDTEGMPAGYEEGPDWLATLTATEKFQIDRGIIAELAAEHGMTAPKGPAGTAVLFHPNILHASMPNLSPFDRSVLILVYNAVGNPPTNEVNPRPEFLATREIRALRPVPAPTRSREER